MQVPSKLVWIKWAASSFFFWWPNVSQTWSLSLLISHNLTDPSWLQLNKELALFQLSDMPITDYLWALKLSTIFLSSKILTLQSSYAPMTHLGCEISLNYTKVLLIGRKIGLYFVVELIDNLLSLNVIVHKRIAIEVAHNKVWIR